MGLFGGKKNKKNADGADEQVTPVVDKKAKAKGSKKKKNELLKVLDESVWESVHEDFKANKQFIVRDDDGSEKYLGLLFDTNLIGGLAGKEAKKDESKGSIIEAIRTGRIKTYIRSEMLMDDLFIIIPDAETIDNMDEFVILTKIPYTLCSVTDDGMIMTETQNGTDDEDDPEITVTFDQVNEIIKDGTSGATLLPNRHYDMFNAGSSDDEDFDIGGDEEIEDLPDDLDDSEDDLSDDILGDDAEDLPDDLDDLGDDDLAGADDLDDLGDDDDLDTDGLEDAPEEDINAEETPQYDDAEYSDEDDGGYDEYGDVTEDVVRDFVVRKFYSDDLGLEVSTQPFDAQFLHGNAYLPFNEDRGTGWLNEYLSNIAKDANIRMERMHNDNLFRMRERYMRLIQGHCVNIAKSLDISDDSTQYGRMRFAIEQNKADNLDSIDRAVENKRTQLEASWESKLDQVGMEAAAAARQQYIDRYGRAHEDDIFKLETREKDEIERDYQNSLRRMNDDRRLEASKLLDLAVNETLKEMSNLYLRVLRDEKKEYIRLQNEMTRFIDDNRKDEKARIDALAEENRQVKKANEVRRDYTAKIKAMAAEFDMKRTMLQADIDRLNHEHEVELESSKTEWANRLEEERGKSNNLQQQVNELLEKYAVLDDKKKNEYAGRITELENLAKTKDDDMNRLVESHKRSNTITILLVIAILIASIGVGFMFGSIMNVRKTSQIEKQGIYQQQPMVIQQEQQEPAMQTIPVEPITPGN